MVENLNILIKPLKKLDQNLEHAMYVHCSLVPRLPSAIITSDDL